jgi:hypothetical protein
LNPCQADSGIAHIFASIAEGVRLWQVRQTDPHQGGRISLFAPTEKRGIHGGVAAAILAAVEGGILPPGIGDDTMVEPPGRMPGSTAGWKPAATSRGVAAIILAAVEGGTGRPESGTTPR